MKRILFLLAPIALVVACSTPPIEPEALAVEPAFGTEPSPFFPSATYELNSVKNHLANIRERVDNAMYNPPDPYQPTVNKLEAMHKELGDLHGRVQTVLMGLPVDASPPKEFFGALGGIQVVAWNIKDMVEGFEPTPFFPEQAFGPLSDVGVAAGAILTLISGVQPLPNVVG